MAVKGTAIIWGVKDAKPIVNLPPDALKVRLRMRPTAPVTAFVRYADRIERWVVVPSTGRLQGDPDWALGILNGVNYA